MVKTYPAIQAVATHGRKAALGAGVLMVLASLAHYYFAPAPVWLGIELLVALISFVGLRIGAEMIEVIAETLLPR